MSFARHLIPSPWPTIDRLSKEDELEASLRGSITSSGEERPFLSFQIDMEGGNTLKRALSCYLIFGMSDEAFEEVFDFAVDTVRFYHESETLELPSEPQTRSVVAGQVEKSDRAEFLSE